MEPQCGTGSQAAHDRTIVAWQDKQEWAKAAIHHRCRYNARALIQGVTTAAEAFAALKPNFCQQGSGVFTELCKQFYKLTLADCKDVTEYTEKFRKIRNELISLHPFLALPESFVVQKFLHGLGPAYNIFQSTFNQTHNILLTTSMIGQLPVPPVTFNLTAMAAVNEERRLANQKDTEARGFLAAPHVNENEAVITVPYCTHCKMNYHTIETCHDLHPELKKAVAEKRKQRGKNNNKCRRPNSTYEPAIETINLMAVGKTSMDLPQTWVIDTGCSQHVTCRCENFVDYQNLPHHPAVGGIRGVELCVMG